MQDPSQTPLNVDNDAESRDITDANRQKVLGAATELFRRQGVNASLEQIARNAGVGIGTVYRKFPARADLVVAAYEPAMIRWTQSVETALSDTDPCRAFVDVLTQVFELQFDYRGFVDVMTMPFPGAPDFEQTRMEGVAGMRKLATRAKKAGCLRADYSPRDFLIFIMANDGIIAAGGDIARVASSRLLGHFLRSICISTSNRLPPAPKLDEVIEAMQHLRGVTT